MLLVLLDKSRAQLSVFNQNSFLHITENIIRAMLTDRVCIITGGGRGLGRAVAVELAKAGASVVVNDLETTVDGEIKHADAAKETVEEIREQGGTAIAHHGDVANFEYTENLVQDTLDHYGAIHGVANFAGIIRDGISYKMTEEQWDDVVRVHLRGHFALLRNLAAHWRAKAKKDQFTSQRSFLCVSSDSAFGNVGQANYAAAKAGVLGLMRTAAREYHGFDVRVNALMPRGYTRMTEQIPKEHRPYTPEERPPEKVAPLVTYLLSDKAADITGCTFWAEGDCIGLVTDPEIHRVAFNDGGWTAEDIAHSFHGTLGHGLELSKTDNPLW